MPASLYEAFDALYAVRKDYLAGQHNSKERLRAAQWAFDLARRTLKHETKVTDKLAKDHPHKPIVDALNASTASMSSTLFMVRDDIVQELHQIIGQQHDLIDTQQNMASAIVNELKELCKVSSSRFL